MIKLKFLCKMCTKSCSTRSNIRLNLKRIPVTKVIPYLKKSLDYKLHKLYEIDSQGKEPLLKGKTNYSWPLCTDLFSSAAFNNANITISTLFYFFYLSNFNEEVNGTEPSPSVSILWDAMIFGITTFSIMTLSIIMNKTRHSA